MIFILLILSYEQLHHGTVQLTENTEVIPQLNKTSAF
jgi:hypothetical protein